MPLLRKKPFERKKPPPNLRPDEEVFHCKLTNELFRDYDEFYERIILCNSLIWSCSITGKPNITYAEALRSEASARNTLNEYPKELKLPVIYLASKTRRTCLRDLADDVYSFIRNRYFAGETVEVNLTDGQWSECQILNVIAPSLNEIDEYVASEGSAQNSADREFWPPATLYQYEVRDLSNKHTEDVMRFHCVKAEKVRRHKGSFTRERNRLFLRQIAVPFDNGIWGIKEEFINKHQITHARYSLLFPGPVPAFHDSTKKSRIPPSPSKFISSGKSKSPRKSGGDSFIKSPTKDVNKRLKTMELHPPPSSSKLKNGPMATNKENKGRSRKRKIKDSMKGAQMTTEEGVGPRKKRLIQQKLTAQVMDMSKVKRSENAKPAAPKPPTEEEKRQMAQVEKQRRIDERTNKRQMIKEEKRRLAEHLKEWNRPREDLECEDLKHLPAPNAVQCRIPNQLFGDFLMILEFVSCFTSLLHTDDYFPGGLSFDQLEKALIEKDGAEVFADVVQLLLSSLFNLQEQEDDEVHETDSQAVVDLDIAGSTDVTREDAVQAATAATSWCQAYQGAPLKSLTLDCATLSELVRLHILTSGGRCGEKSSKWRYQQRGGYTNFDDPGLLLRLEEPQILRVLSVKNIFELPLGCKLKILTCLIDQILTYAAVRDVVDESVEKLKMAKISLRHHQACEIKKERDAAAARRKKRKEDKIKIKEGGVVVEDSKSEAQSPKRDEVRRKQELQKKEKDLQEAMATYQILARATPLGRDRAYRRFWTFNSIPGLFVEDNEEWAGSCLPSPTPHNPALALATDQEEALACVQRLFEERGGNGSDKENEGSERGLTNNHKKPPLSVKNEPELVCGTLLDRVHDSGTGSDVEEEGEVNVKLTNHLVCVADSKSCQVHSTFLPRTKWAFFSREAELDALVGALNPRGLREGHLRQVLLQQRTRILGSMSRCPVHKLDYTRKPVDTPEPRKSGRQQSKKESSNFNFSTGLPVEEIFELTLRDYILDMEEKISMGGFGNLKVKSRELWRKALNAGNYDQQCDKLVWGNKDQSKVLRDSGLDKTVAKIKTEGKTSRPDTPDTTSVSSDGGPPSYEDPGGHLSILKIDEDQDDEEDSGVAVNGTSDSLTVKPIVKQLASAILQVAQCIEHRYLKKPLGEDQKSQEKRLKVLANKKKVKEEEMEEGSEDGREKDDIMTTSSPMERWETSLMASTSISQLYLHFYTLDNSIQWSKSALYARCRICRKQGDGENMLLCDGCNKGYHLYCLKPCLASIPLGDWFCPACRPPEKVQPPRKSRRLFSEESDDEANQDEENEEDEDDESEEGSIHNETCHQCGVGGHVICCDTCPLVFHMECTDPPLRKVPRGVWSCPKCKPHHFANHQSGKRESSPCAPQQLPLSDGGLHFPWREGRRRRWGDEWQGWGQGTGPWWDDGSTTSRRRQCATAAVAKISSIAKRLRSNSWDDTDSTHSSEYRVRKSSSRRRRAEEQEYDDDDDDLEERRRRSASMRGQRRMRRSEIFDGVPAPLDLDVLESLLADISRHTDAWPFMRPVSKSEAPDYHLIIKRPMDFGTMKYKLKIMEYKNNNEFLADALLVFENCQMYNNNITSEYKAGVRLSRYFERRCKELELTLHEVERGSQNGKVSRRC